MTDEEKQRNRRESMDELAPPLEEKSPAGDYTPSPGAKKFYYFKDRVEKAPTLKSAVKMAKSLKKKGPHGRDESPEIRRYMTEQQRVELSSVAEKDVDSDKSVKELLGGLKERTVTGKQEWEQSRHSTIKRHFLKSRSDEDLPEIEVSDREYLEMSEPFANIFGNTARAQILHELIASPSV